MKYDCHDKILAQVKSDLDILIPDWYNNDITNIEIIHGYQGGTTLLKFFRGNGFKNRYKDYISKVEFFDFINPGSTKVYLKNKRRN